MLILSRRSCLNLNYLKSVIRIMLLLNIIHVSIYLSKESEFKDNSLNIDIKKFRLNKHIDLNKNSSINYNEINDRSQNNDLLFSLLLNNDRFEVVKETINNEYKLYNYLKVFPRKIQDADKYLQLYSICSYLSPIISCEIIKSSRMNNKNFGLTDFPWILTDKKYIWNIKSGTYGNVVCGRFFDGFKKIFIYNYDPNLFFFSTYKISKSTQYSTFVYSQEFNSYEQLESNSNIQICVKVFGSSDNAGYFDIWNKENYNLKWLERDLWIFRDKKDLFIKLTPRQIFLSPIYIQKPNNCRKMFSLLRNERNLHLCTVNCKKSVFSTGKYESYYPWNIISGRYWSSFLIMERFYGPTLSDISDYLMSNSVINWTKNSIKNFYLWNIAIVRVLYLFFSTILSFTFSGSLIYQHCDMHVGNLIFISQNWKLKENETYFEPINNKEHEEIIWEIILANIDKIRIIDLTYISSYNIERRNLRGICNTFGEISISDIENWIVFLYNSSRNIENSFEKNRKLSININPLNILINFLEKDDEINKKKPTYIGGSDFWWQNWLFTENITFNDFYNSILGVGNYFNDTLKKIDDLFGNIEIKDSKLIGKSSSYYIEDKDRNKISFPNPVYFEIYLRNMFFVPYNIMLFGNCVFNKKSYYKRSDYFFIAVKSISYYFIADSKSGNLPEWTNKEIIDANTHWNDCLKHSSNFKKFTLKELRNTFFEPCFSDYCLSKKRFPEHITKWIENDKEDKNDYNENSKYLLEISRTDIEFVMSLFIFYQLKFNLKASTSGLNKKLLEYSIILSRSISKKISESYKKIQKISLNQCLYEYKTKLEKIDNETSILGKKICSNIVRTVNYN